MVRGREFFLGGASGRSLPGQTLLRWPYEKILKARRLPGVYPVVSRHLLNEMRTGLSVRPIWTLLEASTEWGGSHLGLHPKIRDLAHVRPRFGYGRIWMLVRREGWDGDPPTSPPLESHCLAPWPRSGSFETQPALG